MVRKEPVGGDGVAEGARLEAQIWYSPGQIVFAADSQGWAPHRTQSNTTAMVKTDSGEDRSPFAGG